MAGVKGKFGELKIDNIVPSENNPRVVNPQTVAFGDLLASVKASGVKVPVMVRPHPKQDGKYELLAGQRRLAAASAAKLKKIGAMIHTGISDEEAFDITFCENFAREDLTPMEEGKAAVILLAKYNGDVHAAASKLGKSISWVNQRAAIENNLSDKVKEKVSEVDYRLWTTSHIQLIVGLPEQLQEDVLDNFEIGWTQEDIPTVQEVRNFVTELLRPLSKAPWSMEELGQFKINDKAKKGIRCCNCSKRSSFQPGLFDDTLDAIELKVNDRCLDPDCWDQRIVQHLLHKAAELRKDQPKLVYLAEGVRGRNTRAGQDLTEQFGSVMFDGDCKEHKKASKVTVPALVVSGPNAGTIKHIKPKQSSSVGTAKRQKDEKGEPVKKTLAKRKKELENKRWFAVLRNMAKAIGNSTAGDIVLAPDTKGPADRTSLLRMTIIRLACFVGTAEDEVVKRHKRKCWEMPNMAKFKGFGYPSQIEAAEDLFRLVKPNLVSIVTYNGPLTATPKDKIDQAKAIAELLGLSIDDMFKRAIKEYPVPKSWAKKK